MYLNPLKTTTDTSQTIWKPSSISFQFDDREPLKRAAGSIGDVVIYPGMEGPFKNTQSIVYDSGLLFQDQLDYVSYSKKYE